MYSAVFSVLRVLLLRALYSPIFWNWKPRDYSVALSEKHTPTKAFDNPMRCPEQHTMTYLATFLQVWQRHMNSSGVSEKDQIEAAWFSITTIASADFSTPLGVLGIDQLRAKAVSSRLSYRYILKTVLVVVAHVYVYRRHSIKNT